jgi:hypothetical protein
MVFPLLNMWKVWTLDPAAPVVKALAQPWYMDLPARYLRTTTYLGLALFTYNFCFPLEMAGTVEPGWVASVFVRNVVIGHILYGGWHHFLYRSQFAGKMKSHKFNPKYPPAEQWNHDRFWSTIGFCLESAIECGALLRPRRCASSLSPPLIGRALDSAALCRRDVPPVGNRESQGLFGLLGVPGVVRRLDAVHSVLA